MGKLKIILLFCAIITIPTYFILKNKNLDFSLPKLSSFKIMKEVNPIQEKIDLIDQSGELIITEDELLSWIKPYAKTIEDLKVTITTSNVTISGNATFPTKSTMDVIVLPKVKDGKLVYEVERMKLGKAKAPDYIANKVTDVVNSQLDKNVNNILIVKSVRLETGQLVLEVKKG